MKRLCYKVRFRRKRCCLRYIRCHFQPDRLRCIRHSVRYYRRHRTRPPLLYHCHRHQRLRITVATRCCHKRHLRRRRQVLRHRADRTQSNSFHRSHRHCPGRHRRKTHRTPRPRFRTYWRSHTGPEHSCHRRCRWHRTHRARRWRKVPQPRSGMNRCNHLPCRCFRRHNTHPTAANHSRRHPPLHKGAGSPARRTTRFHSR